MAIKIRHDAAGIAVNPKELQRNGLGALGGRAGQNRLLQREKFQMDNLQRMQDRMFDFGRMNLANQFQEQRDQRMMVANQNQLQARLEADNKQFMDRRKLAQEDLEAAVQRDIVQQTTKQIEGRVSDIRGMMAQQKYTPEGQRIVSELSGALRSIEAQRDGIRPKEYNALMNKWLDNADRAGLENFVAPQPTIDDAMSTNFKDLGNGYGVIMQPDGKMDVREIDPMKAAASKGGGAAAMSAADYFADDSKYESAKKRALATMQERHLSQNPDATTSPVFDAKQIHDEMLREFNEHQGFLQQLGGSQTGGQGQTGGQAGGQTVGQAVPQQSQPPAATATAAAAAPAQPVAAQPAQQQPVSPQAPQQASPQQIVSDDTLNTLAAQNSQGQQPMSLNGALVAYRAGRMSAEQITEMLQSGRLADNDGKVVNKLPDWFTKPDPATGWPGFLQSVQGNQAADPKAVAATGDSLSPNGQAAVQAGDNTPAIVSRIAAENLRRAKEGMYAGPRDERGNVSGASMQDLVATLEKNPEAVGPGGVSETIRQMITPEAIEEFRKLGSKDPQKDLINYYVNLLTPSMPKPAKAAKVTEIKDPVSRTQAAMLPRPQSMKELHDMYEAGKIKPGGMFIAPDGTMQKYNPPQDQSAAG